MMCVEMIQEFTSDIVRITRSSGKYLNSTTQYGSYVVLYEDFFSVNGRLFPKSERTSVMDLLFVSTPEGDQAYMPDGSLWRNEGLLWLFFSDKDDNKNTDGSISTFVSLSLMRVLVPLSYGAILPTSIAGYNAG